jgi:RecA-family ATPase
VHELLEWVSRVRPCILFIDPLRNCHSLDENDSGGMVMMLQPLQQYAIANDMAVIIVHHSKKIGEDRDGSRRTATAQDMRGSSALFGMADAVLTMTGKGRSQVHIDAVFKRGESWQRIIQLGTWGAEANETIDSTVKDVFQLVSDGRSKRQIMAALSMGSSKLEEACAQLRRLGALTGDGTPTSNGRIIVESAVRRFAPSI